LNVELAKYKTIVFDCDGVLLNSNKTKVQAYYDAAKRMGGTDAEAQEFVDYHIAQGSFPRNGKIQYYLKHILEKVETPKIMQEYLDTFDQILGASLMKCDLAEGLLDLKEETKDADWMVLSGGDQVGLRQIFERRELTQYFECGIYGGPDIKEHVLAREQANGNIQLPALFVGGSKYDHQASTAAGLDFVFLSDWTEVKDWEDYCRDNHIVVLSSLAEMLSLKRSLSPN